MPMQFSTCGNLALSALTAFADFVVRNRKVWNPEVAAPEQDAERVSSCVRAQDPHLRALEQQAQQAAAAALLGGPASPVATPPDSDDEKDEPPPPPPSASRRGGKRGGGACLDVARRAQIPAKLSWLLFIGLVSIL